MLLTPRTYDLARYPDEGRTRPTTSYLLLTQSRRELLLEEERARRMLLLHQTGSVKVGEVVRYTVTYTPSEDRILPSPALLHVKIRNTSALPLRAAYLHGPYTLHVASYPSSFDPNHKVEAPKSSGVPEFEPNLKAGGSWTAKLTVPEDIREVNGKPSPAENVVQKPSATWIIEIASQILFSQSASVSYELLVARDERSLDLGFTAITGNTHGVPGQVQDHQQGKHSHTTNHSAQPKGIYSRAIKLVVDDTTSLWNKPELPEWDQPEQQDQNARDDSHQDAPPQERKQKKIHLVILTHGLHSNLGADLLYLKESIDAAARQAREHRRNRRKEERQNRATDADAKAESTANTSTAPLSGGQESLSDDDDDEDEEEVVVRGFGDNVIRTERGIQYLGKRMAKYVLGLTYPDQPFLPLKKSVGRKISNTFSPAKDKHDEGIPAHAGSSIHHARNRNEPPRAYKYTSISFIGHSLGGLVQTYAIAYIYKHSPQFFENIKPINFIAMASPFLGLSNENPMYVKFALDFGLVGRTGQDLGLTWRAPNIAKTGWSAMVGGLGAQSSKEQQPDPGAKPLLRILPTGPAHIVLRMFRNRTVYSNVVNDGIVPLRTSCLLFLDWRGLGRVEKARRENGLIGTIAGWGWAELTGQNTSPNPSRVAFSDDENEVAESPSFSGDDTAVPQPGVDVTNEDDEARAAAEPHANQFLDGQKRDPEGHVQNDASNAQQSTNTLSTLWNYIRPSGKLTTKDKKMFSRSQTLQNEQAGASSGSAIETSPEVSKDQPRKRPLATRGDSILNDPTNAAGPQKTTIFESAGDILSPPVPPASWITDPSTRARTIFHDRIYHPEDIPPPPTKRPKSHVRSFSSENSNLSQGSAQSGEEGGMRVEEKIARAYHKDLSWRKVLVRLEPDAHNNIVVRRMFANAYGWPVIKHLCDTHFADTYSATTRDENEPAIDRAQGVSSPVSKDGEEVKGQSDSQPPLERSDSEMREAADELQPLQTSPLRQRLLTAESTHSKESTVWDDSYFDGTSDDDDEEHDNRNAIQKFLQLGPPPKNNKDKPTSPTTPTTPEGRGTSEAEIAKFLSSSPPPIDMHRGIGASPRKPSSSSQREPDSLESYGGRSARAPPVANAPQSPKTPKKNTSGVGLRKSLDVSSAPSSPQESRARSGSGVTEQVARMSSSTESK